MNILRWTEYGPPDALEYTEMAPPEPAPGEVLVRVKAVGLNAADLHLLRADPFPVRLFAGLTRPKLRALGADVAGVVEALGPGTTAWKVGDEVFGDLSGCGWGGLAEFVSVPASCLTAKPSRLSFVEAAAVPMASVTAYQALHHGRIQAGQRVLVHGASGGVGTFAVQIARALGARVTAVCSAANADLSSSLGAEEVIDYRTDDFTTRGPVFDLVLAANGDRSLDDYRRALAPGGTYVASGGTMKQLTQAMVQGPWLSLVSGRKFRTMTASPRPEDLRAVLALIEAGQVRPVIDRTYPLSEGSRALAYLEEGHARGKVVVEVP